jgi:RHS repeat-associated protein
VQQIDIYGAVTTFVYDAFGNLAAEYGGIAPPMGGTEYVTADALGSTRLVMSGTQAERHDFQPYGDEITVDSGTWRTGVPGYLNSLNLYGTGTMRQRFTGQERDAETGLDYFQARYFSGVQGRFTSPDPGNAGADPSDPQSWNGYAYVGGNPLAFTDPSGMIAEAIAEAGGGDDDGSGSGDIVVAGFEAAFDWFKSFLRAAARIRIYLMLPGRRCRGWFSLRRERRKRIVLVVLTVIGTPRLRNRQRSCQLHGQMSAVVIGRVRERTRHRNQDLIAPGLSATALPRRGFHTSIPPHQVWPPTVPLGLLEPEPPSLGTWFCSPNTPASMIRVNRKQEPC